MWQIPLGNTKMRSVNNTNGHYQDNRPEWLLDDLGRAHLAAYRDAGVVAFLFGGGAGGTTCACDAIGDGVTNPAAINGNTLASEAAPAAPLRSSSPGAARRRSSLRTPPTTMVGFSAGSRGRYYQDGAMTFSAIGPPAAPTSLRILQ